MTWIYILLAKEVRNASFQHLVTSAQGQLKPCSVRLCAILTETLSRAGPEHPVPLTSWPVALCPDVPAEIWGGGNQNAAFPLCSFRDATSGWWLHKLKASAAVRLVEWTWNKLFIYLETERNCTSPELHCQHQHHPTVGLAELDLSLTFPNATQALAPRWTDSVVTSGEIERGW